MTFSEALPLVRSMVGDKRFCHIMGCVDAADVLAHRFGADVETARFAALLHDVTKEHDRQKQLKTCVEWSIILDEVTFSETALLHAVTGAEYARRMCGADDTVCAAIRWHTTGRANMTILEKIICLADYIEPNRVFPGVEILRKRSEESLEAALAEAFGSTIVHTVKENKIIHPDSILARNSLLVQLKSCGSPI